jgi:hypothetical protein
MGNSEQDTLAEVMTEEDEDFIDAAYCLVLNRAPDAIGAAAYLAALRRGKPKIQILHEMAMSDEAQRSRKIVAGLAEAFVREGLGGADAFVEITAEVGNAEQLLAMIDVDRFIALAYQLLLGRRPDTEGASNYRELLGQGLPKTAVLHALFNSPERAALGLQLPGFLREAFLQAGLPIDDSQGPAAARPDVQPAPHGPDPVTILEARIASLERSVIVLRRLVESHDSYKGVAETGISPEGIRLAVDARAEEIFRDLRRGG